MKTSTYMLVLATIFLLSLASATLLYVYMDPERSLPIAYATMGTALFLAASSFLTVALYAFKRVYYRGVVDVGILHTSIRQGFFLAAGIAGTLVFSKVGILTWRTGALLFFIIFLFELMIQSLQPEA